MPTRLPLLLVSLMILIQRCCQCGDLATQRDDDNYLCDNPKCFVRVLVEGAA